MNVGTSIGPTAGSTTHELRPVIVRLLSNMASAKEIQQYLRRFSQLDAARFAVVKVGGAVLSDDLDNLVSSLAFLQQVGLTPIVVHGAGPQLNEELAREGIATPIVDGLRVTSPAALSVVRRVFQHENLKLVEALQSVGARASSVLGGVFERHPKLTVLFSDLSIGQMLAVFSYLWFMIGPVEQLLNLQYAYYAAGGALTD